MSNSLITQSYLLRSLAQGLPNLNQEQKERYRIIGKVYNQVCQFLNQMSELRNKDIVIADIPYLGKFQLEQQKEVTFFPSQFLSEEIQFKNLVLTDDHIKQGYRQELNLNKVADSASLKKEEVKLILSNLAILIGKYVKRGYQVALDFKMTMNHIVIINQSTVEVTERNKISEYIGSMLNQYSKNSQLSSRVTERSTRFNKSTLSQTRGNKNVNRSQLTSGFSQVRKRGQQYSLLGADPDDVISLAQEIQSKALPDLTKRDPIQGTGRRVHSSLYQSQIDKDSQSNLTFKKHRRQSSIETLKEKEIEKLRQRDMLAAINRESFVINKFNKERQKELRDSLIQQMKEKKQKEDIERDEENRFEVHFPFHQKLKYPQKTNAFMNATVREATKELPDQFVNHAPQFAYRLLKDPQMKETKNSATDRLNQTMNKLVTEKMKQRNEFHSQIENYQKQEEMKKQSQFEFKQHNKQSLQRQMRDEQQRKKFEKEFQHNQDSGYEWMDKFKSPEQAFNNFGPDESPTRVLIQMAKKQQVRNQMRDNLLSQIKDNSIMKKQRQDEELHYGMKLVDMANHMNKQQVENYQNRLKQQQETLRDIWNKQKQERQKFEQAEKIFD